ncbi:hypothetical protein HanIR_Chr07g0340101 [Helianthus annuus]|nr:hypothetical protein HanIR_Chr07g0340101 [Helianthus annuus]
MEWFHEVMTPCGSSLIMDLMASNARRSAVVPFRAAAVLVSVEKVANCTTTAKRNGGMKRGHLALIFGSDSLNQVWYVHNLMQLYILM